MATAIAPTISIIAPVITAGLGTALSKPGLGVVAATSGIASSDWLLPATAVYMVGEAIFNYLYPSATASLPIDHHKVSFIANTTRRGASTFLGSKKCLEGGNACAVTPWVDIEEIVRTQAAAAAALSTASPTKTDTEPKLKIILILALVALGIVVIDKKSSKNHYDFSALPTMKPGERRKMRFTLDNGKTRELTLSRDRDDTHAIDPFAASTVDSVFASHTEKQARGRFALPF